MIRTQIQLTEEQHRALKGWARERGISLAEAVRRCVADRLAEDASEAPRVDQVREVLAVAGKYADPGGPSRVARQHDDVLTEAYRS
jgi:hypothetical protein